MATSRPWVVNASPLILLGKLRQLDLLSMLAPSLVVPEAVIREVAAGAVRDSATAATVAWAQERMRPDVPLAPSVGAWDLGAGESQVIAHCLASPAVAVLDDGEARVCTGARSAVDRYVRSDFARPQTGFDTGGEAADRGIGRRRIVP